MNTPKIDVTGFPRPTVELIGYDGNAFMVMGRTIRAMKRAGWPQDTIDAVMDEARSGDYDHLLATIQVYCEVA